MKRLHLRLFILLFAMWGLSMPGAAQSASLATSDTTVRLVAEAHHPRVASLSSGVENLDNDAVENLIAHVSVGARSESVDWVFNRGESHVDNKTVSYVYDSSSPRLRLTWLWEVRSEHGPIEHVIRIENLESQEVVLPLQKSFIFDWRTPEQDPIQSLYIDKGVDTPSKIGTHLVAVPDEYEWEGKSSPYAETRRGAEREIIPFVLVERLRGMQTGFYVGVEFSGRTKLSLTRSGESVKCEVGLDPLDEGFRTPLKPGEVFETPRVFVGATHGGPDATGNTIRRWVREVLASPATLKDPQYPFAVNSSRGDASVNEDKTLKMIADAASLGFEMFHLSAGWSGDDGHPDAARFPHGLVPIAEAAHAKGLKFGLRVEWAQAAENRSPGSLNARDTKSRDWFATNVPANRSPVDFRSRTIDIGYPPAKAWALQQVERIVTDDRLDMLEHDGYIVAKGCDASDHPQVACEALLKYSDHSSGYVLPDSPNATGVSYHAARAYYDIQSALRKKHPGLLLGVNNDGGRMVDFGSAAHGDYFSITAAHDPLANRRAFYDASFLLPSAMLAAGIEGWVPKFSASDINNFRYMLRSGMMGWFEVMIDTTSWTQQEHDIARRELQLYKDQLRPLIRGADLYHISDRPDGKQWDGIEYYDPHTGHGVVYSFRGSTKTEATHKFILRGMDPSLTYQVRFHDGSSRDRTYRGDELLTSGLLVVLPKMYSSEIVLLEALPSNMPRR